MIVLLTAISGTQTVSPIQNSARLAEERLAGREGGVIMAKWSFRFGISHRAAVHCLVPAPGNVSPVGYFTVSPSSLSGLMFRLSPNAVICSGRMSPTTFTSTTFLGSITVTAIPAKASPPRVCV